MFDLPPDFRLIFILQVREDEALVVAATFLKAAAIEQVEFQFFHTQPAQAIMSKSRECALECHVNPSHRLWLKCSSQFNPCQREVGTGCGVGCWEQALLRVLEIDVVKEPAIAVIGSVHIHANAGDVGAPGRVSA